MNDKEKKPGNPWTKSLLIWVGVLFALVFFVQMIDGGSLYRESCAACHSWSGEGGALLHREAPPLQSATPVQVAEAIRVGPGQMPAFGTAALTKQQVDDVVRYVGYLQDPDDRGGLPLRHLGPVAEGAIGLVGLALVLCLCRWIGERA